MFPWIILLALYIAPAFSGEVSRPELEKKIISRMYIERRFNSYVRPHRNESVFNEPVVVSVNLHVLRLSIDPREQTFDISIYFRQEWNDSRVSYDNEGILESVNFHDVIGFWTPDVFFVNEHSAHFHIVTKPNTFAKIYPDGRILLSQRLSIKASCPMDLRRYPFSWQKCHLQIESYGYTSEDLRLEWKKSGPPITGSPDVAGYNSFFEHQTSWVDFYDVSYSGVTLNIHVRRLLTDFFLHIFIPLTLFFVISLLPFWMTLKQPILRITLSVMAIASNFMALCLNDHLFLHPGYATALDVWVAFNSTLLFVAFFGNVYIIYTGQDGVVDKTDAKNAKDSGKTEKNSLMFLLTKLITRMDSTAKVLLPAAFISFQLFYFFYIIADLQRRRSRFVSVFLANCAEFCRSTTVHGVNQLVKCGSTRLGRIFWCVTIIIAISLGVDLMYQSYVRYENNPVVVSIDKDYFNWNITFPGTTWCVLNRLDEKKARSFIHRKWNVSKGEQFNLYMDFMKVLSNSNYHSLKNFRRFSGDPRFTGLDLQSVMIEINFNDAAYTYVTYFGEQFAYQEILTEEGICYSTSYIAPYISTNATARASAVTQAEPEVCMFYNLPCFARILDIKRPLKYYVHSRYEIPDSMSKFWTVQEEFGIDTYFSFLNTAAHSSLRDLRIQQRRCNLLDEAFPSSESPFYSFRLCQMNCRRRLCMELCNCIPHFYIERAGQRVCGVEGLVCLSRYSQYIISLGANNTKKYPCDCYPSCSTTEYILEKTLYVTSKEFYFSGMRYSWTIDLYPRIAVSRHVIFGFDGLLVNLGGIAGFFVGASIISVIEFIYFFTIRILRRFLAKTAVANALNPALRQNLQKKRMVNRSTDESKEIFATTASKHIPFRL